MNEKNQDGKENIRKKDINEEWSEECDGDDLVYDFHSL